MRWFQQGDVMIKPVEEIPDDARMLSDPVLAHGEASGHTHRAIGLNTQVYQAGTRLFLSAPYGAEIRHEEHKPIQVPRGLYVIEIVREYDHFREIARGVLD
jgi:hypothetical protein